MAASKPDYLLTMLVVLSDLTFSWIPLRNLASLGVTSFSRQKSPPCVFVARKGTRSYAKTARVATSLATIRWDGEQAQFFREKVQKSVIY